MKSEKNMKKKTCDRETYNREKWCLWKVRGMSKKCDGGKHDYKERKDVYEKWGKYGTEECNRKK